MNTVLSIPYSHTKQKTLQRFFFLKEQTSVIFKSSFLWPSQGEPAIQVWATFLSSLLGLVFQGDSQEF